MSAQAYIVDALRSPTGKRKGSLATVHGADLGAHVIKALVERNDIPAADYDDVIFGLRGHHRFSGWRHCPDFLAGSRHALERAGHHD